MSWARTVSGCAFQLVQLLLRQRQRDSPSAGDDLREIPAVADFLADVVAPVVGAGVVAVVLVPEQVVVVGDGIDDAVGRGYRLPRVGPAMVIAGPDSRASA
jgi:hypothetical protein